MIKVTCLFDLVTAYNIKARGIKLYNGKPYLYAEIIWGSNNNTNLCLLFCVDLKTLNIYHIMTS